MSIAVSSGRRPRLACPFPAWGEDGHAFEKLDDWQRIYVNLPGHGQSPVQDGIRSQDDVLDAVLAFVDKSIPSQEFALIGLSRGVSSFEGY